jgi:hypothetical protein
VVALDAVLPQPSQARVERDLTPSTQVAPEGRTVVQPPLGRTASGVVPPATALPADDSRSTRSASRRRTSASIERPCPRLSSFSLSTSSGSRFLIVNVAMSATSWPTMLAL